MRALLLLLQVQGLTVTTAVDRSRVAVGEEVVFTLRAIGYSTAPFQVELPPLDGLALVSRNERTDVVTGGGRIGRAFTLELTLRAEQLGTWAVGPFRVEQGDVSVFSSLESVDVVSAGSLGAVSGPDADLVALLPRVPPPRPGRPSVQTIIGSATLYAGDQLNILTAAWLPRALRLRLRQPPTLTPPALTGVWTVPRRAVAGAVASRVVDGESYDLYVSFQTAYPLNPGSLTIPPARLAWVQPSRQYLSPERRDAVESPPQYVTVRTPPAAGRPAGFGGPVARELRIDYELGASSARAGSALPVTVVVGGFGNVPLWPDPQVSWPTGVRVYQEGTEITPRLIGRRLGGSKRFRFGLVPDSAGSLALPPIEYAFFDPETGRYRTAATPAIVVPVLEPLPVSKQRIALPLKEPAALTPGERLVTLPGWALGLLVATPLLAMLVAGLLRRRRPLPAPAPQEDSVSRFETALRALVPPGTAGTPSALEAALRRAGVEQETAERVVALHLALEAHRYAGAAAASRAPEARELEAALARLPRRSPGAVRAALWLLLLGSAGDLAAQPGVTLYGRREYAAAATAFREEAAVSRPTAARWYDLAAAEFLALRDAEAVAALLPARELAPRDRHVKALWTALVREHEELRHAERPWPVSAEEALIAALVLLWLGALAFVLFRRRVTLWGALLAGAVGAAALGLMLRQQRGIPRAVLAGGASLRVSPHGLAPERGSVPAFSIVRLERRVGDWWLVRSEDAAQGWIPAGILARAPALD